MAISLAVVKSWLPEYTTVDMGRWPHRYKAIQLRDNPRLKARLEEDGFFAFQTTNHGHLVYEHQVVAYYACGGIHAQRRGIVSECGQIEVHHLNGNVRCNEPWNLVYVPVWLHVEVTKHQRRVHKYMSFFSRERMQRMSEATPIFNKRGKPVKDRLSWCVAIMVRSVIATFKYCVFNKMSSVEDMKLASPKEIQYWAHKIGAYMKLGFDTSRVPGYWLNYEPEDMN